MAIILRRESLTETLRNLEEARLRDVGADAPSVAGALEWIVGRHVQVRG